MVRNSNKWYRLNTEVLVYILFIYLFILIIYHLFLFIYFFKY